MYPALIRWFVTVVPMCPLATPMYSILRIMGTDPSSKILVIDEEQKPLGVVSCHELLLGLVYSQPSIYSPSIYEQIVLNPGKLTAVCSVLTGTHQRDTGIDVLPKAIAHQSLQSCLEAMSQPPGVSSSSGPSSQQVAQEVSLHPIACIPSHWSLYDFQAEVMAQTSASSIDQSMAPMAESPGLDWVVVDRQGMALGLLDQQQVWRSLALAPQNSPGHATLNDSEERLSLAPSQAVSTQPTSLEVAVPELDDNTPHNADPEALRHVFLQRLGEAQAYIQALEGKQRAQTIQSQFKDDLMAYISHEIKTPLTALVGLSELLLQKIEAMDAVLSAQPSVQLPEDSNHHGSVTSQHDVRPSEPTVSHHSSTQKQLIERQHLYAHLMHHSSHQLMSLMAVVFDLVHLETGQLTLSPQSVSLEALCQSVYHQAWEDYGRTLQPLETESGERPKRSKTSPSEEKGQTRSQPASVSPSLPPLTQPHRPTHQGVQQDFAPASSLPLTLDIDPAVAEVIVDEHRFKRLLGCLCANALQLRHPQAPIQIRVEQQGTWVAFRVSVQGEGIPREQHAQIFRAVDLLDDSSKTALKGVGLRLLLALRLAEAHGGTLSWWSNPGEGMHVTVLLPGRTTLVSTYASSSALDSSPFVVIADDDPNRINHVFKAISSLDYGVAIARSGPEALDKIRCLDAKTVILNPGLEYYPGVTLLSVLRQKEETQSIPLLFVTPLKSMSRNHSRDHIDTYLPFPVEPTVLQHHLARLIQADAPVQPQPSPKLITVLYANLDLGSRSPATSSTIEDLDLNALLHPHHCRVIEVDSMEQAELLARVWHPDVIIFGVQPSRPSSHSPSPVQSALTALKDCDELARLPIVTLTTESTEFAYSLDLRVFPCLTPLAPVPSNDNQQITSFALLQVIQVAAASPSSQ